MPVELCVVFNDAAMRNRFSVFGRRLMSLTRFLTSHCYRFFQSPDQCFVLKAAEFRPCPNITASRQQNTVRSQMV